MKKHKIHLILAVCLLATNLFFVVACGIGYEMVSVPGGSFLMGDTEYETPVHTVTLSGFSIGKYEVTQAQYRAVMGYNPSAFSKDADRGENKNKRPVENVTWYDAIEFCNKLSKRDGLQAVYNISDRIPKKGYPIKSATVTADRSKNGYRLPTEAQWEFACRAGTTTSWFSGTEDTLDNYAWYDANSNEKTHEVGKKSPNAFGLYDMHGNVWEWCWDRYGDYSGEAQTDPQGVSSGADRVFRGGSWRSSAVGVLSAYRDYVNPNNRGDILGFRIIRP